MLFGAIDKEGNMTVFFTEAKLERIEELVLAFGKEDVIHDVDTLRQYIKDHGVSVVKQQLMLKQIFNGFDV